MHLQVEANTDKCLGDDFLLKEDVFVCVCDDQKCVDQRALSFTRRVSTDAAVLLLSYLLGRDLIDRCFPGRTFLESCSIRNMELSLSRQTVKPTYAEGLSVSK